MTDPKTRKMPIWAFVLLVIVYLAVIQTIPQLAEPDGGAYGEFNTTQDVTRGLWVTVGLGAL